MTDDKIGRDKILNRLRANQDPDFEPPQISVWRSRRRFDSLGDRFETALTSVKGEVYRVASWANALQQVHALLEEVGAAAVVVNDEPPVNTADWSMQRPHLRPEIEWHTVGRTEGNLRDFCARADVGLSSCVAALAETGSVIVSTGAGQSRLATLLPPMHIALVPESRLVPDIFEWIGARGTAGSCTAAHTVIVSGPSKTADIEQTLAIGVHGPKRFAAVVYGE